MRNALSLLSLGLFAAAASAAPLNEFIAVTSRTIPGYVRRTDRDGNFRAESYVVTQGLFLEGSTRENGLARLAFSDVTRTLAPSLAKQNYVPARDTGLADILLVVSWGSTVVENNPQRDRLIESLSGTLKTYTDSISDSGHADTGPLNEMSDFFQWAGENSQRAFAQNAVLLGYADDLKKFHPGFGLQNQDEVTMRAELAEERYFVVLMAYDYQTLRRDKKSKLLWTTRLSVRSPGNSFVEALPVLTLAGSQVFGRQVNELTHLKANLAEGKVSIKPLLYLNEVSDAELKAKNKGE